MAGTGKSKRRTKGERQMLTARVPVDMIDALTAEARRRGVDRTAVLVEILAENYGIPNPFPITETLPLHYAA